MQTRGKAPGPRFQAGRNSLEKPPAKSSVPPANTAPKNTHLSYARVPLDPPTRINAEAGPSRPPEKTRDLINSRQGLRSAKDQDDEIDWVEVEDPCESAAHGVGTGITN